MEVPRSAEPAAAPGGGMTRMALAAPVAAPPAAESGDAAKHPVVHLGVNASLGGRRPFPDDNAWNTEVDHMPVDPSSARYIASIGADAAVDPDFGAGPDGKGFGTPLSSSPATCRATR